MTTHEILKAARALVSARAKWGTGKYYADGRHCALGAIARVIFGASLGKPSRSRDIYEALKVHPAVIAVAAAMDSGGFKCPTDIVLRGNDCEGYEYVLSAYDRAIEATA